MARIRSLHPGQWTDEDFVACSLVARLLALALRNDADDNGVFEWKPVTIKMRVFPVDAVDVPALLAELEQHNIVMRFEHGGKPYGAIRNFCKYQRPKKPKGVHPLPADVGTYVNISARSTEPVGDEGGTGGEKPPQRKEEGGRRNPPKGGGEAAGGEKSPEAKLFEFGKSVLGQGSGGQITKLRKLPGMTDARCLELLTEAGKKHDPPEWIAAVIRNGDDGAKIARRDDEVYRNVL